jgi:hypothetical protein
LIAANCNHEALGLEIGIFAYFLLGLFTYFKIKSDSLKSPLKILSKLTRGQKPGQNRPRLQAKGFPALTRGSWLKEPLFFGRPNFMERI